MTTHNNITKEEVYKAIRTILAYIGENPDREGLLETPRRVAESYHEMFKGYKDNVQAILDKKFYDTANFQDMVLLRDISFNSTCEHHMLPIIGVAHIAYVPNGCIVGISKLARVVQAYAKRLQVQEKMTASIAEAIQKHLVPLGVGVRIAATHHCMTTRGVYAKDSTMDTMHYTGIFASDEKYRNEFLKLTS